MKLWKWNIDVVRLTPGPTDSPPHHVEFWTDTVAGHSSRHAHLELCRKGIVVSLTRAHAGSAEGAPREL